MAADRASMRNVPRPLSLLVLLPTLVGCGPVLTLEIDDPPELAPDLGVSPQPWTEIPFDRGNDPGPTTGATTGGPGTGPSSAVTGDPATTGGPPALAGLRLTEVLANPAGKDGGLGSPEIVEVLSVADATLPLGDLRVLARGWPRLDADDLGLADRVLGPGQLLLLRRFASPDDAPWIGVAVEDGVLAVNFVTAEGLRNADGAVLLVDGDDLAIDALIYGGAPPPSHDLAGAWEGPPTAPSVSGSGWCRSDPGVDSDRAEDWVLCAPSPGVIDLGGDTTGDLGDTTGDTTGDTGDPPANATVVIVEVLSNAPGPSAQEKELEYVEIINLGPDDVDLAEWTIADAIEVDAPGRDPLLYREGDGGCVPATCLTAGARALLVGGAYLGPSGGALVLETDDTTLADGGLSAAEAVVLRRSDESVASTYRVWPDPLADPYPLNVEEPAHRLAFDLADEPASWVLGPASPGVP